MSWDRDSVRMAAEGRRLPLLAAVKGGRCGARTLPAAWTSVRQYEKKPSSRKIRVREPGAWRFACWGQETTFQRFITPGKPQHPVCLCSILQLTVNRGTTYAEEEHSA